MIDPDGYRPNVGIVLMRADGQVFWARRVRRDGWQFPQGGMRSDETPAEAMYRELQEETGLLPEHVVSFTRGVSARALRHLAPVAQGSGAALQEMPVAALQAWLPGSSGGQDRPRRRPPGAQGSRGSRSRG